jgi:aminoglycoside phosphotransferase
LTPRSIALAREVRRLKIGVAMVKQRICGFTDWRTLRCARVWTLAMSTESQSQDLPVRHRLIVRSAGGERMLVDVHPGRLRLPAITTDDRHTAEVDYINAAIADRFGIATTVLRSQSHSEPVDGVVERVHELELRGGEAAGRLQWADAQTVTFEDPADRAAIEQWRGRRNADIADGRDWTRPGWFGEACGWIDAVLAGARLGAAEEIRQVRNWSSSSVLSVRTPGADYYFKALPLTGRVESDLTQYLAQHFPTIAPRLVATHAPRRWLLMAACPGRKLEEVRDVASWQRAVSDYGRLQIGCMARVGDLTALGCPTRSLDSLARRIASIADDAAALRLGKTGGLTDAEHRRLRQAVTALQDRCEELAACGVTLTLEHGDFWPGNVFVDAASCVVIDWEDAAIAHPFFSLAPLTVGLMNAGLGDAQTVERLETAYANTFESIAPPDRLRRALRLAAPLCFLEMASRYRDHHASVVELHPWMRDLVPQTVRLALARQ